MDDRIRYVLHIVKSHYDKALRIDDLASRVNLSSSRLSWLFKRDLGLSIKQLQKDEKLSRASSLLLHTDLRISEVAYKVGFNDLSNFVHVFKHRLGLCPKDFRIRYWGAGYLGHSTRHKRVSVNGGSPHEDVILVDPDDNAIGICGKLEAHRKGYLHRAFSIFVFNRRRQLLLQRRASCKYHSGGLWSNTCCSHPRPGGTLNRDALRRLAEEMGFTCALRPAFSFVYQAAVGNGLQEHEHDHVLIGSFEGAPDPDSQEVEDWRWVGIDRLRSEMRSHEEYFSPWMRLCFERTVTCGSQLGML